MSEANASERQASGAAPTDDQAQEHGAKAAGAPSSSSASPQDLPADHEHTTRHAIDLRGRRWSYDATVGTLRIDAKKTKPAASIFYAAFTALPDGSHPDPARPLTFVFNGGPGSSTTFLLLGSIAPRRIATPDAAPVPAAPYRLVDNEHTLLASSDLVFIDAAGTGFSQIADAAKAELWSVDGDVAGFSAFIRQYLSTHGRWNSPKYVLGESYGTTRGAALAYKLLEDGVALSGLVLISNILDYGHVAGTDDQNYIGYVPTFATVAQYHGRSGAGVDVAEQAQRARAFATGELRQALARGGSLAEADAARVAQRFGELTGLDPAYVRRSDLRVLDSRFRKELLRDERRVVGRYDGRVAGYDLDAASDDETFVVDDAFLDPAYSSLVNAYLRDELGWSGKPERRGFADFDWESAEPGKGWTWRHKLPDHAKTAWGREVPYPLVLPDLAAALVAHPTLKVLVGNGYYDLCTPFFQTEYDIDHLGLPAPLRANVAFCYYPAGHMLYTSEPSLAKFARDLGRFYASDVAGLRGLDERPAPPPLA